MVVCLAGTAWLLKAVQNYLDDWGDGFDGRPYQVHPQLDQFLRHCARLDGDRE
jgi:hypothetical protein